MELQHNNFDGDATNMNGTGSRNMHELVEPQQYYKEQD